MRNARRAAGAVVIVALGGATNNVSAAPAGKPMVVDATFDDPGALTDPGVPRCSPFFGEVCELEFHGHSTVVGSMTGSSDYTMWAEGHPDGSVTWYAHERFTGSVDGCGTGSFEFIVTDGTVGPGPSAEDPAGQDLYGRWTALAGGTGGIRVSSGSGEERGIAYPDTSNHGRVTGTLTCVPR